MTDEHKAHIRAIIAERGYDIVRVQAVHFGWAPEVVEYVMSLDPSVRDSKQKSTARGRGGNERRG